MTDAEEAVYEHPTASDTIIEEFYGNWARSVLRVVPPACLVRLSAWTEFMAGALHGAW